MDLDLVAGLETLNLNEGVFPLLELPDVVKQKFLRFLTIWDLMNLRIVCKDTNKWVEGLHFDKFVLCIQNHVHIEEILNESNGPKWSNLKIVCDSEMHNSSWIDNPLYSNLLQKFSDSLTILTLEFHRVPHSGLHSILNTCKVLKSLKIGTLDCKDVSLDLFFNDSVSHSLSYMEHLSFRFLAWNRDEDLQIFDSMLSKCGSLVTLKAPHILMASLFSIGDTDDEEADRKYLELVQRRLAYPIISYLNTRSQSNQIGSKISLKHLDVETLHHTEVFPTLATACYKNNVRLLNVSEAYESPVPESETLLVESIESICGFTKFLNFKRLINTRSINLDTETSADSAIGSEWIHAELPSLETISFCLPDDIDQSILTCFMKQVRPTVTCLNIEFEVSLTQLSKFFQISDLINNFPGLKSLSLAQWDGSDEDLITILKGLPKLESLRLQRCLNITDNGFIGKDSSNPVISSLKCLKKLWVDCNISDAVLTQAIRNLQLEELFFSSEKITSLGFVSLTDGALASSLIIFQGTQPNDSSDEDFEKALKSFKNLKRGPKYFEYYSDSFKESSNLLGRR